MSIPAASPTLPVIGFIQYDKAIQDYLTMDVYPDPTNKGSEKITLVPIAGPPRAEYATQDKMNADGENPGDRRNQTITVPSIAMSRLNFIFKPSRWTKARFRKLSYTEEGRRVIQSDEPMPFDVMYQIDIWTKNRTTMNQILRNMALKFLSRDVWLKVNLGGPWGERSIPLIWQAGPDELTELDHGSHGNMERRLRSVITLVLQAWIMPDPVTIPTVRDVVHTLYIQENGELIWPTEDETVPLPSWTFAGTTTNSTTSGEDPEIENP